MNYKELLSKIDKAAEGDDALSVNLYYEKSIRKEGRPAKSDFSHEDYAEMLNVFHKLINAGFTYSNLDQEELKQEIVQAKNDTYYQLVYDIVNDLYETSSYGYLSQLFDYFGIGNPYSELKEIYHNFHFDGTVNLFKDFLIENDLEYISSVTVNGYSIKIK